MVSSYLICDLCGGFGPPASFLSSDGLRLCYRCWYRERVKSEDEPLVANDHRPDSETAAAESGDQQPDH